jgi:enamine deaminase RidA (YjgF/YER057c/UK114 family)
MMHRIPLVVTTFLVGATFGLVAQTGMLRHINPPAVSTPTGYTHVVVPAKGAGLVFIAGQVSADKSGAVVGKGDFKAQAKQVFENLKSAVEAAGGTTADIAKINVYVTDLSQIAALREVRQGYFKSNPPASTLVQVVSLARPEYMLEIEAIAVVK